MSPELVELLFRTFSRRWPQLWRQNFGDPAARRLWKMDLDSVKITDAELEGGIRRCATEEFPPSPGRFIAICRESRVAAECHRPWNALPVLRASAETAKENLARIRKVLGGYVEAD